MQILSFDIFRLDSSGLIWVEAAKGLEEAKLRVETLMIDASTCYMILDQSTGNKVWVKSDGGKISFEGQSHAA